MERASAVIHGGATEGSNKGIQRGTPQSPTQTTPQIHISLFSFEIFIFPIFMFYILE